MADERDLLQFTSLMCYVYVPKKREILPRSNPFDDYDDDKFKERFRLSKLTVEKLLEQVWITVDFNLYIRA